MQALVIYGAGKIAEVIASHVLKDKRFEIAAFTCDSRFLNGDSFLGRPLVPFEGVEERFPPTTHSMHVAVGYHSMNSVRARIMGEAKAKGYFLSSVVSQQSWPGPDIACGENCFVADGASIEPSALLGTGVYVWSNSIVGHHATVGDYVWIAAGSAIGGGSRIGDHSFLALNSTVGNEVQVGTECLLGARTLITRDLPNKCVVIERDSAPIRLTSEQFLRISKFR